MAKSEVEVDSEFGFEYRPRKKCCRDVIRVTKLNVLSLQNQS